MLRDILTSSLLLQLANLAIDDRRWSLHVEWGQTAASASQQEPHTSEGKAGPPDKPASTRWYDAEMFSAFGDESSDETRSRVFAVAGILGSDDEWSDVHRKWAQRLDGKVFHAADCEAGRGDFSGMEKSARQQLFRDLTQILVDSKLMGYGYAIDIAGYRNVAPTVLAEFPYMLYYHCFLKTVVHLTDLAATFIPRDRVKFTFDQHKVTQYNAGLLYEWITHFRNDMVENVSFVTRREPGVQAADLWAREVMKRADSHLRNDPSHPRPQLMALLETRRFRAKLSSGSELGEAFADIGVDTDKMAEDYHVWIAKNKLVDNLSNRFRFAAMRVWKTAEQ